MSARASRAFAIALWLCVMSQPAQAQEEHAQNQAQQTQEQTQTLASAPGVTGASYAPPQYPPLNYRPRVWYGYEILLSDAASLGLGLAAAAVSDGNDHQQQGDAAAITWGAGAVGATAVHAAHQNSRLGLAGLGGRLALPPLGALLGVATNCIGKPDKPCSADGARFGFVVGLSGAVLLDSLVFARARPEADNSPTRTWYGWKTLFIDGAALGAAISVAASKPNFDRGDTGAALAIIPFTAGILVAPWMHVFHGRIGLAFASLGLRALTPAFGAVAGIAGFCAASGSEKRCTNEGALYGLFFGTLLIAAVDIGALSYERTPTTTARASTTLVPFILPTSTGATAGLTGTL
jgi:hypothetical protein